MIRASRLHDLCGTGRISVFSSCSLLFMSEQLVFFCLSCFSFSFLFAKKDIYLGGCGGLGQPTTYPLPISLRFPTKRRRYSLLRFSTICTLAASSSAVPNSHKQEERKTRCIPGGGSFVQTNVVQVQYKSKEAIASRPNLQQLHHR